MVGFVEKSQHLTNILWLALWKVLIRKAVEGILVCFSPVRFGIQQKWHFKYELLVRADWNCEESEELNFWDSFWCKFQSEIELNWIGGLQLFTAGCCRCLLCWCWQDMSQSGQEYIHRWDTPPIDHPLIIFFTAINSSLYMYHQNKHTLSH